MGHSIPGLPISENPVDRVLETTISCRTFCPVQSSDPYAGSANQER